MQQQDQRNKGRLDRLASAGQSTLCEFEYDQAVFVLGLLGQLLQAALEVLLRAAHLGFGMAASSCAPHTTVCDSTLQLACSQRRTPAQTA